MQTDQLLILTILAVAVGMFLWGRWRHDMVAIGALLASVVAGLLPASEAFLGLGHPAVVSVACVLVLSRGLQLSGAVDVLARHALPKNAGTTFSLLALVGLGALLPVASVMESTGTANLIARVLLESVAQGSPVGALVLVLLVTMFHSDLINNAATAAVMCPIAIGTAAALGVHADAFLMAVAIGASCAFLTPIGHQNNTLILGPGGFRFGDHWRMGLPVDLLVVAVAVPMLLWAWPL